MTSLIRRTYRFFSSLTLSLSLVSIALLSACGSRSSSLQQSLPTTTATSTSVGVSTAPSQTDPTNSSTGTTGTSSTTESGGTASTTSTAGTASTTPTTGATPTTSPTNTTTTSTTTTATDSSVPANAVVKSQTQTQPGWLWCTAELGGKPCASGLGNASSSMTLNQATPSLSGASSMFQLAGPTHYSNALWWYSFGQNTTASHFIYDLYFYMSDPSAPEALEFDMNQSWGGTRYTWGSECSYKNTGHWDIWNPETEKWVTTNAPCPQVSANEWHHLTWQFERVGGQVHYISVTVDDNVMPIDLYFQPQLGWEGSDLNIAFQMDGDYRQDPYSVWLDKVSVTAW